MERTTKKPRSLVWQYFTKIDDKSVKCVFCKKVFTNFGNTSNFARHIRLQHPNDVSDETPSTSQTITSEIVLNPRIGELNSGLVKMIAKDLQPLSIVENIGFRNFINQLNPLYKLPSRKKVTYDILPEVFQAKKLEVVEKLKNTKHVAITTDIWTSDSNM